MLFAATALFANIVFARSSHWMRADTGVTILSPVALLFLLFTVPYFFSGLGVALVLLSDSRRVGRHYFVNLAGSGAGCFIVQPMLGTLGAEGVTLIILGVAALAATWASLRTARAWLPAALGTSALALLGLAAPESVLPYQPDRSDFYQMSIDRIEEATGNEVEVERVFSRWDAVGRIELHAFPAPHGRLGGSVDALFFAQDAGAPSILLDVEGHPAVRGWLARDSFYGLATSLRPGGEVMVIGLGGGPDLVATLEAGAGRVTGVEINRAVVEVLGEAFRARLGLPEPGGRLRLEHADGRAYASRATGRFDVIQMTGADTYAAGSVSGAILSENYLYTIEAFEDYFRALAPDGILAITRFGLEPLKIVTTAAEVISRFEPDTVPSQHFVLVRQGALWVLTLMKKTPFREDEIREIRAFVANAAASGVDFSLPYYDVAGFSMTSPMAVLYDPGLLGEPAAPDSPIAGILKAADAGRLAALYEKFALVDVRPSTDDRPFFLQMHKLEWPGPSEIFSTSSIDNPLAWSVTRYAAILVQIALVALALIVGPLVAFRRRRLRLAATVPVALYFFSIGIGFMFVEIGLMQRFSLFLGHPNFSISVVLFSLLLFSGLGSLIASRWRFGLQATLGGATAVITLGVLLFAYGSGGFFGLFLDWPIEARVALSIGSLAPIAFFMGMPLPGLLALVESRFPEFAPWALGVNGFASVLGSLATIPLSVSIGFSSTVALGAAAYACAWLSLQWIVRIRA